MTVLCFAFVACSQKEAFFEFHSFPESEWLRSDVVNFQFKPEDISLKYDIFLEIRNNNKYPFRNIWLFVDVIAPDGKQRSDTVNIELADVYGKWHGRGISLFSCSVPYETDVQYLYSGTYTYAIRQGMREETLNGISDIGLSVKAKQ
ncbi:MAG: gliding motility lipoprotein GldH [Dysgonamonadaceae bacterium]|jgi:gliding motility-associated lipoprotein GldH|nr:gliding motility lipoprotein GldH [Dysgonamonadaceae bacterium]